MKKKDLSMFGVLRRGEFIDPYTKIADDAIITIGIDVPVKFLGEAIDGEDLRDKLGKVNDRMAELDEEMTLSIGLSEDD
jgi:hypothetical protein